MAVRFVIVASPSGLEVAETVQSSVEPIVTASLVVHPDFALNRLSVDTMAKRLSRYSAAIVVVSTPDLQTEDRQLGRQEMTLRLGLFPMILGRFRTLVFLPATVTRLLPDALSGLCSRHYDFEASAAAASPKRPPIEHAAVEFVTAIVGEAKAAEAAARPRFFARWLGRFSRRTKLLPAPSLRPIAELPAHSVDAESSASPFRGQDEHLDDPVLVANETQITAAPAVGEFGDAAAVQQRSTNGALLDHGTPSSGAKLPGVANEATSDPNRSNPDAAEPVLFELDSGASSSEPETQRLPRHSMVRDLTRIRISGT